jgi:uncharacterized protein (TIGR03437 family)
VNYISPTQLNVLSPDDNTTGPVQVQVTDSLGMSPPFTVNKAAVSPAFFTFTQRYPAAVHTNGVYLGPPGLMAGAVLSPAAPGETIQLFATGFGPANPPSPVAVVLPAPAVLANAVTVSIGGISAKVTFAGLTGSGLVQLNVVVPSILPDGDAPITASVGGANTQPNMFLTIQH